MQNRKIVFPLLYLMIVLSSLYFLNLSYALYWKLRYAKEFSCFMSLLTKDDVRGIREYIPVMKSYKVLEPDKHVPLFVYIFMTNKFSNYPLPKKSIKFLLEQGLDPNEEFFFNGKPQFFNKAILFCINEYLRTDSYEIAELFLKYTNIFDEDMTDRKCLLTALEDEKRFNLFLNHGARYDKFLLVKMHRKGKYRERSLLEEALVHPLVDLEFFKKIYKLLPNHLSTINPDVFLDNFKMQTNEQKKQQKQKFMFLLSVGFDTNKVFVSEITRQTQTGTILELAKAFKASDIIY